VGPSLVVSIHVVVVTGSTAIGIAQLFDGGDEESERQPHVVVASVGSQRSDGHRDVERDGGTGFGRQGQHGAPPTKSLGSDGQEHDCNGHQHRYCQTHFFSKCAQAAGRSDTDEETGARGCLFILMDGIEM